MNDHPDELTGLNESLRLTIIATYREIAEGSYLFCHDDIVRHCERQISALEFGGSLTIGGAP